MHRLAVALGLGQPCRKFVDDMTQAMDLLLSGDLGRDPAGILDVLMPVEHFRHRGGLRTRRIPEMDGEDLRILARIVVEHRFGRRVREHAAVPIQLARCVPPGTPAAARLKPARD
jgi:hypothetical protein